MKREGTKPYKPARYATSSAQRMVRGAYPRAGPLPPRPTHGHSPGPLFQPPPHFRQGPPPASGNLAPGRPDECEPRENDTQLIRAIRWKNDTQSSKKTCSHPTCMNPRPPGLYEAGNIRLCPQHAPTEEFDVGFLPRCNGGDLIPFAARGVRSMCTQMARSELDQKIKQFLFDCATCGEVCCFCAKRCYMRHHALTNCRFGTGDCNVVEVRQISRVLRMEYVDKHIDNSIRHEFFQL